MSDNRMVFFVMETQKTKDGQFIALIAVEGEPGYNITDWAWGKDLETAEKIADERNLNMGIDKKEAAKIVLGTMRIGRTPRAEQTNSPATKTSQSARSFFRGVPGRGVDY